MLSRLFNLPWPPEFFLKGCPCDPAVFDKIADNACDHCPDGAPVTWKFTVSGITNGTCSACDDYNGVNIELTNFNQVGNVCSWVDGVDAPCASGFTRWNLQLDDSPGGGKLQ